STDALPSENTTLPDGTLQIAGYFALPGAGTRDARTQFFDVQSSAVWRQYSEIDQTSGNTFFNGKTEGTSGLPPPLPIDAARTVVSVSQIAGAAENIAFGGTFLSTAGKTDKLTGRGAQFDISAQDIEVLSQGQIADTGFLGLDATQLSDLG